MGTLGSFLRQKMSITEQYSFIADLKFQHTHAAKLGSTLLLHVIRGFMEMFACEVLKISTNCGHEKSR